MHILFAGGGTAGHINPALAVANYIKNKHPYAEISYIGKKGGLEERLVAEAGINFYPIEVAGFQRSMSVENIKRNMDAVKKVFSASRRSREILLKLKPDIVVGTGGYVSGPVLREAHKLNIKTAIHEQNAFPGVTTKILANKVNLVMLAMPEAKNKMKIKNSFIVTGNPVRGEISGISKQSARAKLNIPLNKKVILSFGGSLGAENINKEIAKIITNNWLNEDIVFIHGTGKGGYSDFIKNLHENSVPTERENIIIKDYLDNTICIPAADLVISRAGAISLTEIGICGKPAIFIPSPNVAENHQYFNALSLKNAGAAELVEEKDINSLENVVLKIINNNDTLEKMSRRVKQLTISNATEKIYEELMKLYTN